MRYPNVSIRVSTAFLGAKGDRLPHAVIELIKTMSLTGYWPVDFGENDGDYVELVFCWGPSISVRQAWEFIESNGNSI